jgi:hypothetical protein
MNERIRELLEQAGVKYTIMPKDTVYEKFAELIVRECISALEEKIHRSIDHEGDEIWADLILKEHFGVEE